MKYWLTLCAGALIVACNQQPETAPPTTAITNPADSELTLYMRHLEREAQGWKETVENGGSVVFNEPMLDSMFTAIPTDGKIEDSLLYDNLGMAFKQEVRNLSNATHPNLSTQYNLMVTACVNCHRNFCPGPIKRIEKLRIKQ